jgi:hypothetical protein
MELYEPRLFQMNDDYFKEQAARVRAIADRADPFTRKRLLDLAERYDLRVGKPSRATRSIPPPNPLPPGAADRQDRSDERALDAPRDPDPR